MREDNAEVVLGDGVCVIKFRGRSNQKIAKILGMDKNGGVTRIWLDKLVHHIRDDTIGGWSVSGAISTILTKEEAN